MQIGVVVGSLWSTKKEKGLTGKKLMIVKPIDLLNEDARLTPVIVVDSIGSGVGETVIYVSGSTARAAMQDESVPVDAVIVGIIDNIEIRDEKLKETRD